MGQHRKDSFLEKITLNIPQYIFTNFQGYVNKKTHHLKSVIQLQMNLSQRIIP